MPKEEICIFLEDTYIERDCALTHTAGALGGYEDDDEITLVKLAPIVWFSESKLTTFSGKNLNCFQLAHAAYSLFKRSTDNNDSTTVFEKSTAKNGSENIQRMKSLQIGVDFMFKFN